jgi:hypothetical protein
VPPPGFYIGAETGKSGENFMQSVVKPLKYWGLVIGL